jgi:hypothetical protein
MRLIPLLLIFFLAALIAPRKSKRLERWMQRRLEKGKRKGRRNAGFLGDWTAKSLLWGQKAVDAVMSAGRRARRWLPV